MNTKKVVFNKLFSKEAAKTQKLSKQRKVQFSLADDLSRLADVVYDKLTDLEGELQDAEGFLNQIETLAFEIDSKGEVMIRAKNELEIYDDEITLALLNYADACDELGIDPRSNENYADLDKLQNSTKIADIVLSVNEILDNKFYPIIKQFR